MGELVICCLLAISIRVIILARLVVCQIKGGKKLVKVV